MSNGVAVNLRSALVNPRESRRVYNPIEDSNERVVSELIPVDAITEDFPLIGMKYRDIDWVNQPENAFFLDYLLRTIKYEGNGFARLTFSRDIPNDGALTPYKVETSFGNHYWHPVLRAVDVLTLPAKFSLKNGDGSFTESSRHILRRRFIPSVNEGSRFVKQYYIHSVPPRIGKYPTPQPASVHIEFLDTSLSIEECLHPRLIIPGERYSQVSILGTIPVGGTPGQTFPATNFEERIPYVISHEPEKIDVLYMSIKTTVYPPQEPEEIIE